MLLEVVVVVVVAILVVMVVLGLQNGVQFGWTRGGRRRSSGRGGARVGGARLLLVRLVLLLVLHAPILEPNFDLPLGERQMVGDLDAAPSRQVAIIVELFLQLQSLVARVGLPAAFALNCN